MRINFSMNEPMTRSCDNETLARNSVAHVQRCADCGSISVHVGPFTFRLEEQALGALWSVLAEADARLETRRPDAPGAAASTIRRWA